MKLSDIVFYKSVLDEFDVWSTSVDSLGEIDKVVNTVGLNNIQISKYSHELTSSAREIRQHIGNFSDKFDSLRKELQLLIDQQEPEFFTNSTNLYNNEMCHDQPDYILRRRKNLLPDSDALIKTRIKLYTDWHYPGLVIRPGVEEYLRDLVALDPMYLVDTHKDLLVSAQRKFPEAYQNRLRKYIIDEYSNDQPRLAQLPQEQFGFCFVYNFFSFKPIEIIKQYLEEIYQCLRPGGVMAFNFNDCDYASGVLLAEHFYSCYTPGKLVKQYIESIGYETLYEAHTVDGLHWLEIKKPGTLKSLRGGQTLATIHQNPVIEEPVPPPVPADPPPADIPIIVDIPDPRVYSDIEIKELQRRAIELQIPCPEVLAPAEVERQINLRTQK
jgi:SAM-dependent methyltransferase